MMIARFSDRQLRLRRLAVFSVLALLPDADVIAFALHVPYEATWGHRGASHSIVFALGCAVVFAFTAARWLLFSRARMFVLAFVALVSHGMLDAMTTGGLGAALLWPFADTRLFFGWRPIPVAPIGLAILRPRGLWLMLHEALLFLPCWIVAAWPRRSSS